MEKKFSRRQFLGLGATAAKAAAEQGAKVIAVEKSPELAAVSMAGDFGVIGSKIQKDLGIEWAGKDVIVNQLMKDMCYRPTPDSSATGTTTPARTSTGSSRAPTSRC